MGYDNMHRITSKKQHLTQLNVQFNGSLSADYDLTYTYQDSTGYKFQLANVQDVNYRTEGTAGENDKVNNGNRYTYDDNGNLIGKSKFAGMRTSQYEVARENSIRILNELRKVYGDDVDLTFTGHSLGGGLAATSSMATGKYAITFNPAAMRTKEYLGDDSHIVNYIAIGKKIISAFGHDV